MDWIKYLDNILKNKKWVRNDIGMGRVQFVKLMEIEEDLMLIIASDNLEAPFYTRVENLLIVNNELILFYDGEYGEMLNKNEYDDYKEYISKEEWNSIFERELSLKLEELNFSSKEEGFYAELHETIEEYMEDQYDEEASEKLREHYGL